MRIRTAMASFDGHAVIDHPIAWVAAVMGALTVLWAGLGAPESLITEIAIYTLYGAGVKLLGGQYPALSLSERRCFLAARLMRPRFQ